MNRRELAKFQDPGIREDYLAKYGDPLEDVGPEDIMDLMENLWGSQKGTYFQLRHELTKQGRDPWTARQELAEVYFRTLYLREHELDEAEDKAKVSDVSDFIMARVQELIREAQRMEAEEADKTRGKFGTRLPFRA
jgi:hypothetical protein